MGAQQQQIGQNESLFPLQTAAQQAAILRGYTIPTSVASSYTGPIPGAYSASPLQQIAGLGSLLGALNQSPAGGGKTPAENFFSLVGTGYDALKNIFTNPNTSDPNTANNLFSNYGYNNINSGYTAPNEEE